jgi:hypothetical protein
VEEEKIIIFDFLADIKNKLLYLRALLCLTLVLCCWKFGDIKNWRNHYPTILYLIVNNLLYSFFVGEKNILWKLESDFLLDTTFSFLVQTFINFPCIVILFLTFLPKSSKKVIIYLIISGSILLGIETIMLLLEKSLIITVGIIGGH